MSAGQILSVAKDLHQPPRVGDPKAWMGGSLVGIPDLRLKVGVREIDRIQGRLDLVVESCAGGIGG